MKRPASPHEDEHDAGEHRRVAQELLHNQQEVAAPAGGHVMDDVHSVAPVRPRVSFQSTGGALVWAASDIIMLRSNRINADLIGGDPDHFSQHGTCM
jgi:hypothetical protein